MKKSLKITAALLSLVMLCFCLASCGNRLKDTYEATVLGTGTVLEFDGKNVTVSFTVLGKSVGSTDATYTIKKDKITFEFANEDEIDNMLAKQVIEILEEPASFKNNGDSIKIGSLTFDKVDA